MYYGGESNVPGAPGNLFAGGIPLRQFFPNAPSDIPFAPGAPGVIRPGSKQKLKDIFPSVPGGYGGEDGGPRYGTTPGGVASNPFGPQFEIPGRKPVGQPVLPGEDKKAIEDVYGIPGPKPMPGTAPLGLPMAFGSSNLPGAVGNMAGMANAGFYAGPQFNQPGATFIPPAGFQGKYVS